MDPTWVFNFFTFFERILYKSNCIIFIFSWCGTYTKIRSKLVIIVTAGSQKITLWGPQRTPHGILRVKMLRQDTIRRKMSGLLRQKVTMFTQRQAPYCEPEFWVVVTLRLWCYGPPSRESRLGHRDFHTFGPLKETWLATRFQQMTTWTRCNILATNTWHEFLVSWSAILTVVMGQMPKWHWWLLGGLMISIC